MVIEEQHVNCAVCTVYQGFIFNCLMGLCDVFLGQLALLGFDFKTSQELRMLSSVTLDCQVSQLSES